MLQEIKKSWKCSYVRHLEEKFADASPRLMERAGEALCRKILSTAPGGACILIVCGSGNNGGDGYDLAAKLSSSAKASDYSIACAKLSAGKPKTKDAAISYEMCLTKGVRMLEPELAFRGFAEDALASQVPLFVMDAVLGIGINDAPRGIAMDAIEKINELSSRGAYVIGVDIPSGLNADTGFAPGVCVRCDETITFIRAKPGLFTGFGPEVSGRVTLDDLGIGDDHFPNEPPVCMSSFASESANLPVRRKTAHKGDSGKCALVGGGPGMPGAIIMAAGAALRTGAGLTKLISIGDTLAPAVARHPELMVCNAWEDTDAARAAAKWSDCGAIGPGLGKSSWAKKIFDAFAYSAKRLIADADALSFLPKGGLGIPLIITPHPGEAAGLLECGIEEILKDRIGAAKEISCRYSASVLLKGAGTVAADGDAASIVNEGCEALAVGGSGDVLTGILCALWAARPDLDAYSVAKLGAALHGRAGFNAAKGCPIGMLPTDLYLEIRNLINQRT